MRAVGWYHEQSCHYASVGTSCLAGYYYSMQWIALGKTIDGFSSPAPSGAMKANQQEESFPSVQDCCFCVLKPHSVEFSAIGFYCLREITIACIVFAGKWKFKLFLRFHIIFFRMAITRNTKTTNVYLDVVKREVIYTVGGSISIATNLVINLEVYKKKPHMTKYTNLGHIHKWFYILLFRHLHIHSHHCFIHNN